MHRREFLTKVGLLAATMPGLRSRFALVSRHGGSSKGRASIPEPRILFKTSDAKYQQTYSNAVSTLNGNVKELPEYPDPVLIEGSVYGGIWLEGAPHEGLVYSLVRPHVARANHMAFFVRQREDGQIPCWIRANATGFGQIQMVVPIAATAWALAQQTGDDELLDKAYASCVRWDAWLRRYRDTRKTGLCEGFCTWDTGHDNSPRWSGIPNRCPNGDARKCPSVAGLPRLCPDLSATVYGGRVALAEMARALGKNAEADRWRADAEQIRSAIVQRLYAPEDAAFYDVDAQNRFVGIRSDVISRVLGEHVVDQKLFEAIYAHQIHNRDAFWVPYPLPSIALNDPAFVRPIPRNSWGGASQTLTALRAPRWMEHYGKPADLAHLMQQWVEAIVREGKFLQQMDPVTGMFTPDAEGYSPAALAFVDFTWRLSAIRQTGDCLEWNIRPLNSDVRASFGLRLKNGTTAEIRYASAEAEALLNGKIVIKTGATVRLMSTLQGRLLRAVGVASQSSVVAWRSNTGHERRFSIQPNETQILAPSS
jgi:hypothetical protein